VLGGIASGKSALAEALAACCGRPRVYLATAQAGDAEMAAKIAAHRARRGPGWTCIEAPVDLSGALAAVPAGAVVLIDCVTLWLSNLLHAGLDPEAEGARLLAALARAPGPVVVVTNEVGGGGIAANALARRFARAQGALNQRLAAEAGLVVAVMAGLPLVLKGRLPDGAA
jgi:adenosylcobinamide kinase/adenosylcobinamide-phosphate guanylyltransferase